MLSPFLALLAAALQAEAAPPAGRPALQVEGGYAQDLPLEPGARVHVWARMDARTQVFLAWEGAAAQHLDAANSWHAVLTVPEEGLAEPVLRARIATPKLSAQSLSFQGPTREKQVEYLAPAGGPARALAFYCHDSTGRRNALLKSEAWNLALTFAHQGYAVASISSEEAEDMKAGDDGQLRWNGKDEALADNVDMQNLLAAREALVAAGVVAADADCFAIGQGNGGTFAASAAAVLGWRGAALICGPGRKQLLEKTAAPTVWVMTKQNPIYRTAADTAVEIRATLEAAGVPAKIYWVEPSPLRFERWVDRCGMDERVAEETYAAMKASAVVDAHGRLQLNAVSVIKRVEDEKLTYESFHIWLAEDPARVAEFMNQIMIVDAGHAILADHAPRILDFFEQQRGE